MRALRAVHGGLDAGELRSLGLAPEEVLDFSANINPLGPSPQVARAAVEADLASYPDRESLALREVLAARLRVEKGNVLVGNGSTELIHLIGRALLGPGRRCLLFTPTFGEYEAAAVAAKAEIHCLRSTEERDFRPLLAAACEAIDTLRPQLTFLCNPNNPTGVYLGRREVERIAAAIGDGGLLVLDDAYAGLADSPWDAAPLLASGNVAILRSMTKDHALAGIRLGYMVAQPEVVAAAAALQHAWSVNAVAQSAGLAALDDEAHVGAARRVVGDSRAYLVSELSRLGLAVVPSAANFLLMRVGHAAAVRSALLSRGVAVRDCTSFGLPDHIRIGIRRRDECRRLVEALAEVLPGG